LILLVRVEKDLPREIRLKLTNFKDSSVSLNFPLIAHYYILFWVMILKIKIGLFTCVAQGLIFK